MDAETIRCDQTGYTTDEHDSDWVSVGHEVCGQWHCHVITPFGRLEQICVMLPRELHFLNRAHAADWLGTAISEHVARCGQEDAENERRGEHEAALAMNALYTEMHARRSGVAT